jgi:hypothetical protein
MGRRLQLPWHNQKQRLAPAMWLCHVNVQDFAGRQVLQQPCAVRAHLPRAGMDPSDCIWAIVGCVITQCSIAPTPDAVACAQQHSITWKLS